MWIMTKTGFYSAVQHRDDPSLLMVRARSLADLDHLLDTLDTLGFDRPDVLPTRIADYPFRAIMDKTAFAAAIGHLITDPTAGITYDNYKNQVHRTNPERARTYGRVWSDLLDIEHEPTSGIEVFSGNGAR